MNPLSWLSHYENSARSFPVLFQLDFKNFCEFHDMSPMWEEHFQLAREAAC